jgi:hypothetical protein
VQNPGVCHISCNAIHIPPSEVPPGRTPYRTQNLRHMLHYHLGHASPPFSRLGEAMLFLQSLWQNRRRIIREIKFWADYIPEWTCHCSGHLQLPFHIGLLCTHESEAGDPSQGHWVFPWIPRHNVAQSPVHPHPCRRWRWELALMTQQPDIILWIIREFDMVVKRMYMYWRWIRYLHVRQWIPSSFPSNTLRAPTKCTN